MNERTDSFDDMAYFLRHALTLEEDAVDTYETIADCLETHNNEDAATFFREMAAMGQKHADYVARAAIGYSLPRLAPWEFSWCGDRSAEVAVIQECHYLMGVGHALKIVLDAEKNAESFYQSIVSVSTNLQVIAMASGFAEEEKEHVQLIQEKLDNFPLEGEGRYHDPDPAHIPE